MVAHRQRQVSAGSCESSVTNDVDSEDPRKAKGWGLSPEFGAISDDEEEEEEDVSPCRRRLQCIVESTAAHAVLGCLIALSLVVVIVETDATIDGDETPETINKINVVFTSLYAAELMVRFYVYRLTFFGHWFNVMDTVIVLVDIFLKLFQQSSVVSTLRIFRLAKLGRVLVLLDQFPELHTILRGIFYTIKSIFWGMCLLTIVILVWSVLAVQLIHPLNKDIDYGDCERCGRAFAGVFNSSITIFQTVVAGDSWGQVAVPIIERCPAALAYFALVFVSISLLVLNLILATTVERAAAATEDDQTELNNRRIQEKKKAYKVAEKRIKALCKAMDKDGNGALNLEEVMDGYRNNPEFHKEMELMDIKIDDMQTVFKVLDVDGSGDVGYEEFVESLHMMKTRDSHTLLMFTHQLVEDVLAKSTKELKLLTSKKGGLVKHISDEVTRKTLQELRPVVEISAKHMPMPMFGGELGARDGEGGRTDDVELASWSSAVFSPMDEYQGPDRALVDASDAAPPAAPVALGASDAAAAAAPATSRTEMKTPHIGGPKGNRECEGDCGAPSPQDDEGNFGGINRESVSFAVYCRREGGGKFDEALHRDVAIDGAKEARDGASKERFGDGIGSRGLQASL